MRNIHLIVIAGCAAAILLVANRFIPLSVGDFLFRALSVVILAVSWNLMAGAGLISLGHAGFYGLGAYIAILLANRSLSFPASLAVSLLGGSLLGASLAIITGRLKGIYFAIATLAMSEGLRVAAAMLPDLTGGSGGAYLSTASSPTTLQIQSMMIVAATLTFLVAWLLSRSRYHFALRAMRANENASQMLGISPLRYRIIVMSISGAMASIAGGVEVWNGGYLDPAVAFDLQNTIMAQIAPVLGGIYTLIGPVLGSVATVAIGDITRLTFGSIEGLSLLMFGALLVFAVLYLPHGIAGAVKAVFKRFFTSRITPEHLLLRGRNGHS